VDGAEQPGLEFALREAGTGVVTITSASPWLARAGLADWQYVLRFEGRVVPDVIHEDASTLPVAAGSPDIAEHVLAGDRVVWYRVSWQARSADDAQGASPIDVHRRYRDFFMLYSQVCSAYRGTHLYSSVPEVPGRELFSPDQTNPEFIAARQQGLQVWLRRLVKLPGVAGGRNPDVEEFLGVGGAPGICETSLVFGPGKLGMRLARPLQGGGKGSFSAQLAAFIPSAQDPGQAESSGRVRAGDMVVRVAGESAILLDYDAVVEALKVAPRPLVVHFLGVR
jgi:hypothetical protein